MPTKIRTGRTSSKSRKSAKQRIKQKRQGCQASIGDISETPVIIANSLFALTLPAKRGYEVVKDEISVFEKDAAGIAADLLASVNRARLLLNLGKPINKQWTNANEKPTGQKLKTVVQLFPKLKSIKEEKQGPSCSLAEALEKQDLFINSTLAQFGCNLLWKLIKEGQLKYHGCYVNLESMIVNPIKIN